jgi:asparagine synthase (glutamine-hydrolysing)
MSSFILDISLKRTDIEPAERSFYLEYSSSDKFFKDKVNYEDDFNFILFDGIALNKTELSIQNSSADLKDLLINLYHKNGNQFFKQIKGSYYGFLFDKREKKWIIFSDHIGSKPIYFSKYKNHIFYGNDYFALTNYLRQKGQTITLNVQAAKLILTYGFVFEDITITNEIRRLLIGHFALICNGSMILEKFYFLKNKPSAMSEKDAVEQIDEYFRKAVKLSFEKDAEYGYKHVTTLSGGLDSRMTVWVAHELGYVSQLNLTFSQCNYLDESIPKKIAADLKHDWLFKALDNGIFLKNLDSTCCLTGGNVLYYGLAHALSLYNYVNFNGLGLMHTGQLGDVIISTFYSTLNNEKQYSFGDGAYSKKLLNTIDSLSFIDDYPNEEIFKMYMRGFYCANQGNLAIHKFTETYSPFYDIDFMEFALTIPVQLRFKHNIYKKWIVEKYPDAAKYTWEREKVPVNYPFRVNINGAGVPISQIPNKILSKLGYNKYGLDKTNHMNPLEYWYKTNSDLKEFMDDYYKEDISLLESYPELQNYCAELYFKTHGTEKNQVLTLLGAMKMIIKA